MKRSHAIATVTGVMFMVLMLPVVAMAFQVTGGGGNQTQNPYGYWYAGKEACGQEGCHRSIATQPSPHSEMVKDIRANPDELYPAADSGLWPFTSPLGGISVRPRDIYLQLGDDEGFLEYTGSEGSAIATKVVPVDDLPVWSPANFLIRENRLEAQTSKLGNSVYAQSCGQCHNVGLTRPSNATYTLPSGAVQTTKTPTTVSELGIQCEACHGSGKNPNGHKNGVPGVVGGYQILKSQVCGQCHVTATAPQKNVGGGAFGNPNGYTTDATLSAYLTPSSVVETEGQMMAYVNGQTATKPKFLPNGDNFSMRHVYYNEWLVNKTPVASGGEHGHADPLNEEVKAEAAAGNTKCLRCHSGLSFLNRIDAKAPSGTRIVATPPAYSLVTTADPGISCMICHTGHIQFAEGGGYDTARRWGNGEEVTCANCHNWQYEQLDKTLQYETIGSTEYSRPAKNARVNYAQREMVSGGAGGDDGLGGLWGVAPMGTGMPGVTCNDCHMPRTSKEGMPANDDGSPEATRMSHRFHITLPGDAARWKLRPNGDSCAAGCHKEDAASYTRADFQAWIDQKAAAVASASAEATGALNSVATGLGLSDWTAFIATQPGSGAAGALPAAQWAMLQHAAQNVDMVHTDGSGGIHNPDYAIAGLAKAKLWAQSTGATISAELNSPIAYGDGMTVSGSLLGTGGVPIDDAEVVLETSTNGSAPWTPVATAAPAADGDFAIPTGLIVGNRYFRVRFSPAAGVDYTSTLMHVAVPVTTASVTPAAASATWSNIASAQVTLTATPGATIMYTLTGATIKAPTAYSGPITITAEGRTEVRFWAYDADGTEAAQMVPILIDRANPTVNTDVAVRYAEKGVVHVWSADSGAGVARLVYTFRGMTRTVYGSSFTLTTTALGKNTLTVRAYDRAGKSTSKSVVVWVRTTPKFAVTPLTKTISKGGSVTFAATVKTASGALLVGEPVALQRWNGSSWVTVVVRTTNSSGRVARAVTFGTTGTKWYRWHISADTRCAAGNSAFMKVVVK